MRRQLSLAFYWLTLFSEIELNNAENNSSTQRTAFLSSIFGRFEGGIAADSRARLFLFVS